jgi:hypothetical protein
MAKTATREKNKKPLPGRLKKRAQTKKPKRRWHEEAVIHQDVLFAEAPTGP